MNNQDIMEMTEFRKFVNNYIYPSSEFIFNDFISQSFNPTRIDCATSPSRIIKFDTTIDMSGDTKNEYIESIHILVRDIFIAFFNNQEVVSLFKKMLHENGYSTGGKLQMLSILTKVQLGYPQYLGILFNVTFAGDMIYLYL